MAQSAEVQSPPLAESSAADGAAPAVVSTSRRLLSIDVLRGIAVLAVVVSHLPFSSVLVADRPDVFGTHGVLPHWQAALLEYGRYGVHLFLVISGFCIHLPWTRAAKGTPFQLGDFWRRRLRRLYPPYAAAVLVTVGLGFLYHTGLAHHAGGQSLAAHFGFKDGKTMAVDLASLTLLLQNITNSGAHIGNGPLWTLALEEQLYALYAVLILLRGRIGWKAALPVVLISTMAWRSVGFGPLDPFESAWFRVGPSRWAEWVLGAIAVEAHFGRIHLPRWMASIWTALLLIPVLVILSPPDGPSRIFGAWLVSDLAFGFFFFVLVNWMCALERAGKLPVRGLVPVLAFVGVFSYSIYLTHSFVLVAAKQVAMRIGLGTVGVLAVRFFGSVAFGYLFFRVVERRFLSSFRRAPT